MYNIGTGVGVTLNDFARVISKHLPKAKIEIGPATEFPRHALSGAPASTTCRARGTELGYEPEYDLERGIADYLESLKRLKM